MHFYRNYCQYIFIEIIANTFLKKLLPMNFYRNYCQCIFIEIIANAFL